MKFGIAMYRSADIDKITIIYPLAQKANSFLETRDYGAGVQDYIIGIICMSSEFDYKWKEEKKKYYKTKRLLEYDIKLNYAQVENATENGIKQIFAGRWLDSLGVIEELKIKNFDTDKFREDLILFFEQNGIEWDKEPEQVILSSGSKIKEIEELKIQNFDTNRFKEDLISFFQIKGIEKDKEPASPFSPHIVTEPQEQNSTNNKFFELFEFKEGLDNIGKISLLIELKTKIKFPAEVWEERGLNPSAPEIISIMNNVADELIEKIIFGLKADYDEQALKQIINQVVLKLDEFSFDTEELELLCDWIAALARLVNIKIAKELNRCLYGDLSELF